MNHRLSGWTERNQANKERKNEKKGKKEENEENEENVWLKILMSLFVSE
jgi:hypothetical protein